MHLCNLRNYRELNFTSILQKLSERLDYCQTSRQDVVVAEYCINSTQVSVGC